MDRVGLSAEEKSDLFRVVAAVLHLGNIMFAENTADKKGVSRVCVCLSVCVSYLAIVGVMHMGHSDCMIHQQSVTLSST